MASLINENREDYEKKWNDIKVVIEYGIVTEEKFAEKADKFTLYPTTDGKYFLWNELEEKSNLLKRIKTKTGSSLCYQC
jgi:molecular chaperone HtpG